MRIIKPRFLSDYPRSLGARDIGLRDLIESAALLGSLPVIRLITISVADIGTMTTELTPAVQGALGQVIQSVRRILCEGGVSWVGRGDIASAAAKG